MDEQVLDRLRSSDRFDLDDFAPSWRRLETLRALERAVQYGNTSLKEFDIGLQYAADGISNDEMALLTRVLGKCVGLVELDMSCGDLTDEQARLLAQILPALTNLEKLFLDYNMIGDEGIRALVGSTANMGLKMLFLCNNRFGAEGTAALAKSLHGDTSLVRLSLPGSSIGVDGIRALAGALRINNTLEKLEISCPEDEMPPNAEALREAVMQNQNSALKELRLGLTSYIGHEPANENQKRDHGLSLNAIGRRHLSHINESRVRGEFHPSLWANVFARSDSIYPTNGLHFFLKHALDDILPFMANKKSRRYPLRVRKKRRLDFTCH